MKMEKDSQSSPRIDNGIYKCFCCLSYKVLFSIFSSDPSHKGPYFPFIFTYGVS